MQNNGEREKEREIIHSVLKFFEGFLKKVPIRNLQKRPKINIKYS